MHQWSYMVRDDQFAGPVSEAAFLDAVKSGLVQPTTKVHSDTRTNGKWVQADQIPSLNSVLEKLPSPIAQDVRDYAVATKVKKFEWHKALTNLPPFRFVALAVVVLGLAVYLMSGFDLSTPTPYASPARTTFQNGPSRGERAAGMELAKKNIGEQGVFPTNAKYPWENVKSKLLKDDGAFQVYLVTGTVESGSRSATWESHILYSYQDDKFACIGVFVNGVEIWALPLSE